MVHTERIWKDFNGELLRFIKVRVNDVSVAEDILQDVFVKIHKNITSIAKEEKITSWVYQITRNTIIDYYRKKKLDTTHLDFEILNTSETEEEEVRFTACLRPFIDQLPEDYKKVLLSTSFGKVSQKEFAENEKLSYSTVKSRVQRGKEKLKKLFVDCCALEADKYGNIIGSKNDNCDC